MDKTFSIILPHKAQPLWPVVVQMSQKGKRLDSTKILAHSPFFQLFYYSEKLYDQRRIFLAQGFK